MLTSCLYIARLLTAFRLIIIPVQFQDCEFTTDYAAMEETVSNAGLYLNEQFKDKYEFSLSLAPVVTLSGTVAHYGANYPDRRDYLLYEAVREACILSNKDVDFSDVDELALICAGTSEMDGAPEDRIWPQHDRMENHGVSLTLDGRTINSYSVTCELKLGNGGNPRPIGHGILCHEILHAFGLADTYDTDGESSGGVAQGLNGFSIMAYDCLDNDGFSPPNFNATELYLLGLGTCKTLAPGEWTLDPIDRSRMFIKAEGSHEGEVFLFECRRDSGLVIYHIDKSAQRAGYSDYYKEVLSAVQRWDNNQVNCRPDRECAKLVHGGLPSGGIDSFTSDSEVPFRYWDGTPDKHAISGIKKHSDGSVSFNVSVPLETSKVTPFQTVALLNWVCDKSLAVQEVTVSWQKEGEEISNASMKECSGYMIEGLEPLTEYRYEICVKAEGTSYSTAGRFTTKALVDSTVPYIYINSPTRNADGSFLKGTRIPLHVFNAGGVAEVEWTFNGSPATVGTDALFLIEKSGELRAKVNYVDGTKEVILKKLVVK